MIRWGEDLGAPGICHLQKMSAPDLSRSVGLALPKIPVNLTFASKDMLG